MTRYLGAAVLIVLAGGMGVLAWLQRRRERREAAQLAQDKRGHTYRFEGHDEALRLRTEKRRQAAESIRKRASSVESGAPVTDVLRRIK